MKNKNKSFLFIFLTTIIIICKIIPEISTSTTNYLKEEEVQNSTSKINTKSKNSLTINQNLIALNEIRTDSLVLDRVNLQNGLETKSSMYSKTLESISVVAHSLVVNHIKSSSGVITIEGNITIKADAVDLPSESGSNSGSNSPSISTPAESGRLLEEMLEGKSENGLGSLEVKISDIFDRAPYQNDKDDINKSKNISENNERVFSGLKALVENSLRGDGKNDLESLLKGLLRKGDMRDIQRLSPGENNKQYKIKARSFSVRNVEQWQLTHIDDFENDYLIKDSKNDTSSNQAENAEINSDGYNMRINKENEKNKEAKSNIDEIGSKLLSNNGLTINEENKGNNKKIDTSNSTNSWSGEGVKLRTSFCKDSQGNKHLGGHCVLSKGEITKIFDNLPPHKHVKVQALIHMLDKWNGESVYLKLNNKIIWSKQAKADEGAVDVCGNTSGDVIFGLPIEVIFPHISDALELTFGSTLLRDPCEVSYGVDDIMIYVK